MDGGTRIGRRGDGADAAAERDPEFTLDGAKLSVVRVTDQDDSVAYRPTRPVEERLQVLELLRRTFYCDRAGAIVLARDFKEFLKLFDSNRGEYLIMNA